MDEDVFRCSDCGRDVPRPEAIRREPMGDLDPTRWQTFCCPHCGRRIETAFVADERGEVGSE